MIMDKKITLIIDDREKAVVPFFATQPIKYKVGRITTGDYVLLEKSGMRTSTFV